MRPDYRSEQESEKNPRRKMFVRRRACRFCTDKELKLDYKNARILSFFISERGKITPRRISGTCALHQRDVNTAIKRARQMAIIPFTSTQR